MKNPELFNKTVAILVKAYMNNTLEHYNCYACAVGNIVAANCGFNLVKSDQPGNPEYHAGWYGTLIFEPKLKFEHILTRFTSEGAVGSPIAKIHLEKTGYSFNEICKIEVAFECPNFHGDNDRHMYDGLMSVIDCLMEIHEATTEEVQQAKELFVKA